MKSVYMMPSKFGFRSGKFNNDWHQLSSLITVWIGWKFHKMVVLSDLTEIVCRHKVWSKKIYQTQGMKQEDLPELVCFPIDILQS